MIVVDDEPGSQVTGPARASRDILDDGAQRTPTRAHAGESSEGATDFYTTSAQEGAQSPAHA
jgi:hypothetical protein